MTEDVQAIKNLVYSYAELLDTGDLDGIAAMFERAGVRMSESNEIRGSDAMRSLIADTVQLYDGIPRTKHVITNVIVEIDADGFSATARSYYTALQEHPDLPLQPILAGRWHDRLEKRDGQWLIVDRVIFNDLAGNVNRHLKGAQ
jgi:3-phenylpropionate/cinnamic acid dioxygenase small subunit